MEYTEATATTCLACGQYFRLASEPKNDRRRLKFKLVKSARQDISCYECSTMQSIPADVHSWECSNCGTHLDFSDHEINSGVTTNIRTFGGVTIGLKGHYLGGEIRAAWVRLSGLCMGNIIVGEQVTVEGPARVKGIIEAPHFQIAKGGALETENPMKFKTAIIHGPLKGKQLFVQDELRVTSTGSVSVANMHLGSVFVEPGGGLSGNLEILPLDLSETASTQN